MIAALLAAAATVVLPQVPGLYHGPGCAGHPARPPGWVNLVAGRVPVGRRLSSPSPLDPATQRFDGKSRYFGTGARSG